MVTLFHIWKFQRFEEERFRSRISLPNTFAVIIAYREAWRPFCATLVGYASEKVALDDLGNCGIFG